MFILINIMNFIDFKDNYIILRKDHNFRIYIEKKIYILFIINNICL